MEHYPDNYMDVVSYTKKRNKSKKIKNTKKTKKNRESIQKRKREEIIRTKRQIPIDSNAMDVEEYYSNEKQKTKFTRNIQKIKLRVEKKKRLEMLKKMNKNLSNEPEIVKNIINITQPVTQINVITLFVMAHGIDTNSILQNIDNTLMLSFPGLSNVCGVYATKSTNPLFESFPNIINTIQSHIDKYVVMTDFLNDFQQYYKSKYLNLLKNVTIDSDICKKIGINGCKNIIFSNTQQIGIDFIIPFFDHIYDIQNIIVDGNELASINIINHTVHTTYNNGNIDIHKKDKHLTFEEIYMEFLNKTGNQQLSDIKINNTTNKINEISLSSLHRIFNTVFDNLQLNVIDASCRYKSDKEIDSTELFTFIHEKEKAANLMQQRKQKNIG